MGFLALYEAVRAGGWTLIGEKKWILDKLVDERMIYPLSMGLVARNSPLTCHRSKAQLLIFMFIFDFAPNHALCYLWKHLVQYFLPTPYILPILA